MHSNPPPHRRLVLAGIAALCLSTATAARAQIVLDLNDLILQPNLAGQMFTISVQNNGPAVDLTGVQLDFMVGDGGPEIGGGIEGPHITGGSVIDSGLFFSPNNVGETGAGNFGLSLNQLYQFKTSTSSGSSLNMGLGSFALATIQFDTTGGIAPGVYDWTASGSPNGASFFTGTGGSPVINPTLFTGTLSVVPEPQQTALLIGTGLIGFAAWRRMRKKTAPQPATCI
jgi:hypothetical protein